MLSKNELKDLKSRLPRGYFRRTLAKVDFSEKTVANFFSGVSYHIEIHQAALDIAEEYQAQLRELKRRQVASGG
ncbi:hypothetical protein [Cyclobacterium xiamenense]|uniref:hypothetical protein n=1 Tax=Cyclobacterium xiamenense TaxID=1297121 RepID=UPI0035CEEB10